MEKASNPARRRPSGLWVLVPVVFVLVVVYLFVRGNLTTVEPDEVGVEVRWGRVQGGTKPPGIYFKPFSTIHRLSTRTQTYTMAGAGTETHADGAVNALARDQLVVTLDVSVLFHLDGNRAIDVFRVYGTDYDDRIVHPLVRTAVRDAASEFSAVDLVDRRAALQERMNMLVRDALTTTLRGRGVDSRAVVIDTLLIRNIDLPASLDDAIAAVQRQRQATQAAMQATETAHQDAARVLTAAQGEVAAQIARAEANARVVRLQAEAQADANRALAASLTPTLLRYHQIEATRAVLASSGTRTVFLPGSAPPNLLLPTAP